MKLNVSRPYDVVCPTCKRGVDEGCRTFGANSRGTSLYKPHASRTRKSAKEAARHGDVSPDLAQYREKHWRAAEASFELRIAELVELAAAGGHLLVWWHKDLINGADRGTLQRRIEDDMAGHLKWAERAQPT